MTTIERGVPCNDNGASLPFDARGWQNQANAELAGLWGRSTCWLNSIGGTPSAITALCSPTETAYAKNKAYWLVPTADNPTAVEIDIDGLGLRTVSDAFGNLLEGGEFIAAGLYLLVDDGSQLRLVLSASGAGASGSGAPDIIIEDRKTSGTPGGTFTAGSWLVRDLTTAVVNNVAAASFAGNRITLPAGEYFARWSCPASACGAHRSTLYNETDAAVIAYGTSEREVPGTGDTSRSEGSAIFSIGASKTFLLQHQCGTTAATNGFGQPSSLAVEIYSRLEIWKVGQTDPQVSGVPGGALTFLFTFSSTATDADPGNGLMRLNAAAGAATQAFVDTRDFYLNDISGVLPTIATSTSTTKARLRLEKRGDPTKWATYDVTGDASPSGYHKFTLTNPNVSPSLFANGDVVIARFDTVGQRGLQGPAGDLPKVINKLSTPPGSPTTGDAYIVLPTGTGAWAGHNNTIATWSGSVWTFNTPADDDLVWDSTANQLNYYDAASTSYKIATNTTITPELFGAFGDGASALDGAMTSGSAVLSTANVFTAADVGKPINVIGAGSAGALLSTTILSVASGVATLAANAASSVSAKYFEYGHDDTVALVAFLAAVAGKTGTFTPGKTYLFNANPSTSHQMIVQSNTHLVGYGATLKALVTAGSNCSNLWLCDSTEGTLVGPSNSSIDGLTVNGNSTARRAAGTFSGVGAAATFYMISATNCHLRDCISIDAEGDGFYMGGDDTQGGPCNYCSFDHCTASLSGRNGTSFVGTLGCDAFHCTAHDITYGSAHSNISDGFDCEPNGLTSRNIGLTLTCCKAISCTEAGLAAHGASANNIHVNWISPYTQSCGVGCYAANTAPNIRVVAHRYFGNTTNFTNVVEALPSFP